MGGGERGPLGRHAQVIKGCTASPRYVHPILPSLLNSRFWVCFTLFPYTVHSLRCLWFCLGPCVSVWAYSERSLVVRLGLLFVSPYPLSARLRVHIRILRVFLACLDSTHAFSGIAPFGLPLPHHTPPAAVSAQLEYDLPFFL